MMGVVIHVVIKWCTHEHLVFGGGHLMEHIRRPVINTSIISPLAPVLSIIPRSKDRGLSYTNKVLLPMTYCG